MIIVEGPDGGGKTSLAKRLCADLSIPIAPKVVNSDTEMMLDLREWVASNIETGLTRTIFDRHRLISEPIYGPVLRAQPQPGFDHFGWLRTMQRALRQMRPMVIFCLPPLSTVMDNVMHDPENRRVAEHIETIYWLYFQRAASWPHGESLALWDYVNHDNQYKGLLTMVSEWLDKRGLHG